MGGVPSLLLHPPWLAPVEKTKPVVRLLAPRARPMTIRWRANEREKLLARPRTERFLSQLAHRGEAAVPELLAQLAEASAEDIDALARVDAPVLAPLMAHWLATGRTRPRGRTWLLAHPEAAANALVPQALAEDRAGRASAVRALELLPPEIVRAEAVALGVEDALAQSFTLDPLARRPARLPTLGPSIVVERLARPRTKDGAPLPEYALEHLVMLLLISTPAERHAGLAVVRTALDGLADFAWEAFEAWLAVGAPPTEDWPLTALAAFGDDGTARRLAPLIRAWPGESQSARALKGLDILAAIGTDVALMHLHGIAEKVKYRALQERARAHVDGIADARRLTPEELGDRLVPDLGLDPDGSRTLDFGTRTFRVGFDEQLAPFVVDAAGKRLGAFPKPGKTDEPARAAAAVAAWRALKADAKTIASAQVGRLERAMVASRRWSPEGFQRHVVAHPLVGHLARRLVWGAYGDTVTTFRVAEDRSLATVADAIFVANAPVGVVHPLEAALEGWREVFSDYELLSPFPQLDRETFTITDVERDATTTMRFAGCVVPPRALFALEHRGWRRGYMPDGAFLYELRRTIRREGDEDLVVTLSFAGEDDGERLPIGSLTIEGATFGALSPIVFSEIIRDVALVARVRDA